MIKRYCDVCDKVINRYIEHEWRDSEMQWYKLIKKHFDGRTDYEIDICNECLHKVVALTRGELQIREVKNNDKRRETDSRH